MSGAGDCSQVAKIAAEVQGYNDARERVRGRLTFETDETPCSAPCTMLFYCRSPWHHRAAGFVAEETLRPHFFTDYCLVGSPHA